MQKKCLAGTAFKAKKSPIQLGFELIIYKSFRFHVGGFVPPLPHPQGSWHAFPIFLPRVKESSIHNRGANLKTCEFGFLGFLTLQTSATLTAVKKLLLQTWERQRKYVPLLPVSRSQETSLIWKGDFWVTRKTIFGSSKNPSFTPRAHSYP